jgi:hypothetical protein
MRKTAWEDVLARFSDISGLLKICIVKPSGKFTFIPPDPEKKYTLDEITDIINDGLATQRLILIRRQAAFWIQSMDEPIDGSHRRIDLSDLKHLGKAELTQMIVPLAKLKAAEVAPEVEKLLTPNGKVIFLQKTNSLVLLDTVASLRRVVKLIDEIDGAENWKK